MSLNAAGPPLYRFGRFQVRPAERLVLADGLPAPLGARAFDVLVWLIENRTRMVPKQELLDAVWPGLVVEENNLSVQVSALRKVLGAGVIATVPGLGYRFAAELAEEEVADSGTGDGQDAVRAEPPEDTKPAVAVLPFSALSADPLDALLADGLVADVIALLARVPGFFVISRGSSFVFRQRASDLREVARQLSVRYLVEGTVRSVGPVVRVTTELTDAANGRILWSGEFESPRDSAVDLQDDIARGLASRLQPELRRAEIALVKRQRRENLDAWACYHQAIDAIANNGWGEKALELARMHLRSAISADPDFGLAHALYGLYTALGMNLGLVAGPPSLHDDVLAVLDDALRLDGQNAEVLGFVGCALSDLGYLDRAVELLQEAIAIDPSNAQARVSLGAALAMQGRWSEGAEAMRLGMRISPRDRRLAFWGWVLARYLLQHDQAGEALSELVTACSRDPRLYLARIGQAAALARLRGAAAAVEPLKRALQLRPKLTLDEIVLTHGARVAAELTPVWEAAGGSFPR